MNGIIKKNNALKERRNAFLKDRLANLSHRRSVGRKALVEASRTLAAQRTLAQVRRLERHDVITDDPIEYQITDAFLY